MMIFTIPVLAHVVISLIGIGSGLVVLAGMLKAKRIEGWTGLFLATTVLTSVTGVFLPAPHILPSHVIAILSFIVLGIAIYARYISHLAGGWRRTYAITAAIALYFNVFVLVAQSFMKVDALKALAPTQSEPPFLIAQVVVMAIFVWLGVLAAKNFR